MTSPFDPLPRDIFRQMRLANEAAAGLSNWRDQLKALDSSPIQTMMERWRRDEAARKTLFGHEDLLARFRTMNELVPRHEALLAKPFLAPSVVAFAQEQARLAQGMALPSVLERFRTPIEPLSAKLLKLDMLGIGHTARQLEAFARASAMSDFMGQSLRVDRDLLAATRAFSLSAMPAYDTLASYRGFLDAAGLRLPR